MKTSIIAAVKNKTAREKMARGVIASLFGMFVMACSGCGGGGGSPSSQTTAPAPPKTVLIEVYGDSTALGCTVTPGAPAGGPCIAAGYAVANPNASQDLQSQLQAKYGTTITVVDHGVAGTTAARLLAGDGVNLPWAQQMAQSKANIVTFNFGINDSKVDANEPVAAFQDNEAHLIQIAKAAGKTVVLETANPVTDPACAAMPSYVQASITTAKTWGINMIDEYGYLSTQNGWRSMLSDQEHPTSAGYALKAQLDFQVLDPIVQYAINH